MTAGPGERAEEARERHPRAAIAEFALKSREDVHIIRRSVQDRQESARDRAPWRVGVPVHESLLAAAACFPARPASEDGLSCRSELDVFGREPCARSAHRPCRGPAHPGLATVRQPLDGRWCVRRGPATPGQRGGAPRAGRRAIARPCRMRQCGPVGAARSPPCKHRDAPLPSRPWEWPQGYAAYGRPRPRRATAAWRTRLRRADHSSGRPAHPRGNRLGPTPRNIGCWIGHSPARTTVRPYREPGTVS